jgi:hypothetical protein
MWLARHASIALRTAHLAVKKMPGSAEPGEQLHDAGIDSVAIVDAVKALIPKSEEEGIPGSQRSAPRCHSCGTSATWRVVLGAEDEPGDEANACDEHAEGHQRLFRITRETRRSA